MRLTSSSLLPALAALSLAGGCSSDPADPPPAPCQGVAVDDGHACTADACDPATGAVSHVPVPVDDGIACTVDSCLPSTGAVSHAPDDARCPAGQACSPTAGCQAPPSGCAAIQPVAGTAVRLQTVVASGLAQPIHVSAPPGDAARLFVVEQAGRIRLVKEGVLQAAPYLDLAAQVASGGERGLLSVAFHPSFATNGRLYVYFTGNGTGGPDAGAFGDIRIVEVTVPDPAADAAGAATLVNLRTIGHQAYGNHNGGQLAFGPDGMLYAGTGDGGGGGDPLGSGQDTASPLGKLLRIDPSTPGAPAAGNPFGTDVYHYGLRNPWRFSFDRETGDLYVGDVGQNLWEEIDFQAASGPGLPPAPGTNWGWNVMEGTHCYSPSSGCDASGKALPVAEYSHAEGQSVTGGFVYRGRAMPDLAGTYFYGDFGSGFVRTLRVVGGAATDVRDVSADLGGRLPGLASFGEDGCGELYLVRLSGSLSRIAPGP